MYLSDPEPCVRRSLAACALPPNTRYLTFPMRPDPWELDHSKRNGGMEQCENNWARTAMHDVRLRGIVAKALSKNLIHCLLLAGYDSVVMKSE
jgi:hypothetical protein